MTLEAKTAAILANLETTRFWTAATIAVRTGIATSEVNAILDEFHADGLVTAKCHDARRLTYRLAA